MLVRRQRMNALRQIAPTMFALFSKPVLFERGVRRSSASVKGHQFEVYTAVLR